MRLTSVRPFTAWVVLGACVVTAGACGSGGGGGPDVAAAPGGKPLHAPANFDPTLPGFVACSRLIVEADVLSVTDGHEPGHMSTKLAVHDWVKPSSGPR